MGIFSTTNRPSAPSFTKSARICRLLSVADLDERIGLLRDEITRLEAERAGKRCHAQLGGGAFQPARDRK